MNRKSDKTAATLLLVPVMGILLFVLLYVIATLLYPCGSQANAHSMGFSWLHNYWCNLLNEVAMNGQPNPAKPVAMAGMVVLYSALSFFWYLFPRYTVSGKRAASIIQVAGIASMMIVLFLFISLHNVVTNVASLPGVIAMGGKYITNEGCFIS